MQRNSLRSRLLAVSCAAVLAASVLAGCIPGVNQPYPTFTPDHTLEAIPRMLTATGAAPTITSTVYHTPTPTRTATATPPRPGSQALPGGLGERIQAGDLALTVLSISEPATIGDLRKKEKTRYVDLEVMVEHTGKAGSGSEAAYNRLFFLLVGEETEYESLPEAAGPVLLSGNLRPGEWVRGHVAFAIPEDERAASLRYYPQDENQEVWVRLNSQAAKTAPVPATGGADLIAGLPEPGQRIEVDGLALQIEQVSAAKRIQIAKPEKGHIFVDLLVTITNDAYDSVPFNAGYFRVKDAQGYEYSPTTAPSEALIHAGSLRRGEEVRGHVIFEVPENTRELMLQYQPQVLTEEYEAIRVGIAVPVAK